MELRNPESLQAISNILTKEHIKDRLSSLDDVERESMQKVPQLEGRLGPAAVKMDVSSHVGTFIISTDRLGVSSQCNFGSLRACTCVYKGKWQYEVQLGTNGVMQIGWSTLGTKFSQEKGVGDTEDSYAYDGNRVRKWNRSTSKYGEIWQAGDIIGCLMDLDEGEITFLRNGKNLGVAFTRIPMGPSIAYFPAISLASQENVVLNFGATPLQFPVQGFSPMQSETTATNAKSTLLLSWFETLLSVYKPNEHDYQSSDFVTMLVTVNRIFDFLGPYLHSGYVVEQSFYPFVSRVLGLSERISHTDTIKEDEPLHYDRVSIVLDLMWTLLEESEIKSVLEKLCIVLLNQFRSNCMSLEYPLQHHSLLCLTSLAKHRKTRRYLVRYLLLDRSCRLVQFLHVRPIDESMLRQVIPETWWQGKSEQSSASYLSYQTSCQEIHRRVVKLQRLQVSLLKTLLINSDGTDKRPSSRALFLKRFRNFVRDVIRPGSVLQQSVQKAMCAFFCLLVTVSELFAEEIEQSNKLKLPDFPPSLFYDTSVAYFDMERVGGLASYLYKVHHQEISAKLSIPDYIQATQSTDHEPIMSVVIEESNEPRAGPAPPSGHPGTATTSTSINRSALIPRDTLPIYREGTIPPPPPMPRTPMLTSISISVRGNALRLPDTVVTPPEETTSASSSINTAGSGNRTIQMGHFGTPSGHNGFLIPMTDFRNIDRGFSFYPGGFIGLAGLDHRNNRIQPQNPAVALLGKDSGPIAALFSLRELLDNVIILFNSGVENNIERVVSLRSTMTGYEEGLKEANRLFEVTPDATEKEEIKKSIAIFTSKLEDQSRHMAWIKSAVFTEERQRLAYELLKTVLKTLQMASAEGNLFSFVPDHYIASLVNLNSLILNHMHPTVPSTNIADLPSVLSEVAEFVAIHFADPRIIVADTKDTLTQALSMFICDRQMLTALEEMPKDSRMNMVKALLRPYENRAWAQSNWMLVRMWQGDGFAFHYINSQESRRAFRAKPVQEEFGVATNLPPIPSKILQNHVAEVVSSDQQFAVSYIHSVLNQLNWSFSEFIGLLQEIQAAANRPERVFVESRQLKICCTCFELSQALLRVVEMVISISPLVVTDMTRDSAEPLLARLSMLLSQVLNRIGSNAGSFAAVIDLDIPGLENVTYFPMLSAVSGILVALMTPEIEKRIESEVPVTKVVLSEPSFQVRSLDFLLGTNQSNVPERKLQFSLRNYVPTDVSDEEIQALQKVITHLVYWSEKFNSMDEVDDDVVCTICYAYEKNVTLKPCNHRVCKNCILHHLMNRGECFFCKAVILEVFMDDGTKIYDVSTRPEPSERLIGHMI